MWPEFVFENRSKALKILDVRDKCDLIRTEVQLERMAQNIHHRALSPSREFQIACEPLVCGSSRMLVGAHDIAV